MKGWKAFINGSPRRVVRVIEDGPFPLSQYESEKLSWPDKKRGIMRYKGGNNQLSMKRGMKAVVYFDPDFCTSHSLIDVPDNITDQHAEKNVIAEFKEL